MFRFAASTLAFALAMTSIGANAVPSSIDSGVAPSEGSSETRVLKASPAENVGPAHEHRVDVVYSPANCGGQQAPRTLPSGSSTLCVDGFLRVINETDFYAYDLRVSKTVNGEVRERRNMTVTGPIGQPSVLKFGPETAYAVHFGTFVLLDPKVKLKDGSVLMDVDFSYAEPERIKNVTTPDGLEIPDVRVITQRSMVRLNPGKPLKIVTISMDADGRSEERVEVELTAKPLAN